MNSVSPLDSATLRPSACLEPQSRSPTPSIPSPAGGEAYSLTLRPLSELAWWGLRGTRLAQDPGPVPGSGSFGRTPPPPWAPFVIGGLDSAMCSLVFS